MIEEIIYIIWFLIPMIIFLLLFICVYKLLLIIKEINEIVDRYKMESFLNDMFVDYYGKKKSEKDKKNKKV